MGWASYTQTIEPGQQQEVIRQALNTLKELPFADLRNPARLSERARQAVDAAIAAMNLIVPAQTRLALVQEIASRMSGLGFLNNLLPPARNDLEEIAINPDGGIYLMRKSAIDFEAYRGAAPSKDEVWRAVEALLAPMNRSISEATPSVNAKLPRAEDFGGARIKVIHPCIASGANGTGFPAANIRLFEPKPVRPEQLLAWNVAPEAVIRDLLNLVAAQARLLILGGTRMGKTTLLSALCNGIPYTARVVKAEDPEEIWIVHPNQVTLEAREAMVGSSVAPVTLNDCVINAMRMSPRWLIVGEVRTGDAAKTLFSAMMSDHPGLSTFHADGPENAVHRIALLMGQDAGVNADKARDLFTQAIDVVVQVGMVDGRRQIVGVWEVAPRLVAGEVQFHSLYQPGDNGLTPPGRLRPRLSLAPPTAALELSEAEAPILIARSVAAEAAEEITV